MHDLTIIGAGPAGLVSGIYAGRFRLKTLIFEKMSVGGQIILSPNIENYPGFPEGITTFGLIEKFKQQVQELTVPIVMEEVFSITAARAGSAHYYRLKCADKEYETKTVIVASGAQAKRLGIPGENELIGRGVSYCGTCDAPFFKDKEIVVVGGGDRAVEEAIFLASYAKKVTLIHRRKEFRCSKILEEKLRAHSRIALCLENVVEEIIGKQRVEGVRIKHVGSGESAAYPCQGVFVFVGIKPNTDFVRNLLQLDEPGFIMTGQDLKTSLTGIYACGDCRQKSLYQVVNACGEGAVAADSVHKYLLNLK